VDPVPDPLLLRKSGSVWFARGLKPRSLVFGYFHICNAEFVNQLLLCVSDLGNTNL